MPELLSEIRRLAILMAEEATKAFPNDLDAQRAMVRGAGKIADSFVVAKTDREDFASRPKW